MKTCPNCGEILGNHADTCFKCRYSFKLCKVMTTEERDKMEEIRISEINKRKEYEEKEKEREILTQKERLEFIQQLPLYEYKTVTLIDTINGIIDVEALNSTLEKYSKEGWRLHTAFSNEAGRNTSSVGIGGFSTGSNATLDQIILIFERLLSKGTI